MTFAVQKSEKPGTGRIVISVSMEPSLAELIIELAELEGLAKSVVARQMLRYAVESMKGDEE